MADHNQPAPDFEALRAERNAARKEFAERMKADGWNVSGCMHNMNDACYCACPNGPCEHTWDGPAFEGDNLFSATCSRCGVLSFTHSMRVMP